MLQGKRCRRAIAATLFVILFTNTVAPTVTYALTSGPTAPEATSFEPIDTTDMVNLQTGDLTYSIPLLEVPGPEGGYPLTLSYHAGIQPNEDASWTGLGWVLNAGAITRSVNGTPDDWYVPTNSSHAYWSGGQTKTYDIGVNIGIANTPATVGVGLSFSQDTYRGFGIGPSMSIGYKIKGTPFGVGVSMGASPYGGGYVGVSGSVSAQYKWLTASLGISLATNFESLNAGVSGGVGYSFRSPGHDNPISGSLLRASIGTGSGKPSLEVGGLSSSVSSSVEAGIQTSHSGFGIDVPVWYGVNVSLGWSKTRYWIDKTTAITAHGSLYSSGWAEGSNHEVMDNVSYDTYSLLERPEDKNIIDYPDPTKVQGGAYLDYDVYNVSAQGLGGSMRPYIFKAEVLGQNRKKENGDALVTYYSPGVTDPTPQFRFNGDFSNSYRQTYPDYSNPNLNLRLIEPPFDANPVYGNNDGNYGFSGNKLAGSKHIDVGVKIQPSNITGYNKTDRYKSFMIDGFSITNESGVTYHYGLPVYSWDEETYQEKISRTNGLFFNRGAKPDAYAYTWYLTSITGPDFVDRNNNQQADASDWGYWINFEYGKWSNNYVWRNPSEGFHRDEDNEFQNCSMGRKEVYYLNAIRTRSHVALFEKDVRADAKGASNDVFTKNGGNQDYTYPGDFDFSSASSMKLSHIYLMNIADANAVPLNAGTMSANVLDATDVDAVNRAAVEAKAIRVIDLNYDYSLCANTVNSFTVMGQLTGKLTLLSVNTRGKGGANLLPATRFQYDLGSDAISQSDVTITAANGGTPANITTTNGNFNVGDLITCSVVSGIFYGGVIMTKSQSGSTFTYTLANCTYTGSPATGTVTTTKNPSYNKDAFDIWGMYKSDYNTAVTAGNENLGRITSTISARSSDAWSLRKISSPTGSAIKLLYESDDYYKSAVDNGDYSFAASSATQVSGNPSRWRLGIAEAAIGLNNYYQVNDPIQFVMVIRSVDPNSVVGAFCAWVDLKFTNEIYDTKNSANTTFIREVGPDYLIVENPDFASWWVSPIPVKYVDGSSITTTCIRNKVPNACNIKVPERLVVPGGGIRVKKITVEDNSINSSSSIVYNYNSLVNPNSSSGVTSYEPWVLEKTVMLHPNPSDVDGPKLYKSTVYKSIHTLLSIAREIPPPGVMYEYVSVSSEIKNADEAGTRQLEGKTQYQFEVFRENMIGRDPVSSQQGSNSLGTYYVKNIAMKKFTGSVGNIKRIIEYDKDGKKINETINQYLHDGLENLPSADFMTQYKSRLLQFNYQGYIQERYAEVKEVSNQDNAADNGVKATLSAREEYPCIQTGQTIINNLDGTRTASENTAFDFYSGAVTKTVETDAWGNRFMTEAIPAYRKYPAMGLKLNDGNNKNMLSQTTGSYGYKVDANNNKLGLVKAEITVWSNGVPVIDKDGNAYTQNNFSNGNVWRPQSTWLWMPDGKTADGLTATGSFVDFNWTTPASSDPGWKISEELTLYDVYSKALEAKDMYNNYVTTRMGYNNTKVVLTGGPANYYEIAYSGAEDEGIDKSSNLFVKRGNGFITPNGVAHTGKQCLTLAPHGSKGLIYTVSTNNLTAGRNYTAGVWVRAGTIGTPSNVQMYYSLNGTVQASSISSGSSTKIAGDWAFINLTIPGTAITPGNTLEVGCINNDLNNVAYIDDLRFQPLDAQTTAYVYDPFSGELTHILNNYNLYTKYEYDGVGRLVKTYREKLNAGALKLTEQQYNMGACVHKNFEQSQVFTRNSCGSGLTGTMVRYTVPAGTYCSDISPADAGNQAMRDIAANGQQHANNRGACVVGGIIQVNASNLPVSVPAMLVAFVGSTFNGNWPCWNGTTYANLPPGTYNLQIFQNDNVSRTVTVSGYGSQTGTNVTFNNVVIGTTQLTITIN